jgi:hypothetical protein
MDKINANSAMKLVTAINKCDIGTRKRRKTGVMRINVMLETRKDRLIRFSAVAEKDVTRLSLVGQSVPSLSFIIVFSLLVTLYIHGRLFLCSWTGFTYPNGRSRVREYVVSNKLLIKVWFLPWGVHKVGIVEYVVILPGIEWFIGPMASWSTTGGCDSAVSQVLAKRPDFA